MTNSVVLIGRLTRDPELRYLTTGSNTAYVRFNLAVDRGLSREKKAEMEASNKSTADFINIVAWGKLAENVANYSGKGRLVGVSGRIQTGSYEKDGQKIYTTEVLADSVQFLDWKDDRQEERPMDGFYQVSNDDIPF